jgi:TnpA family transposase
MSANQGSPRQAVYQRKADQYPAIQSLISTTSLNLKEIEIHWREVLRLAISIKQETVTASLMLKKPATRSKKDLPNH